MAIHAGVGVKVEQVVEKEAGVGTTSKCIQPMVFFR